MLNRIIQVRKEKKLSQDEFAKKLNLSRSFINQAETGKKNYSDRTISDICRVFNVNEKWLRTGDGDPYMPDPTNELEALARKYPAMTHETLVLIETLVKLPKENQLVIANFLRSVVAGFADVEPGTLAVPQGLPDVDLTPEEIESLREKGGDLYVNSLLSEKKQGSQAPSAKESGVG